MYKESFESLEDYQINESFEPLVNESLILEKGNDDDGALGKIIDRGLSFVPRAMRFKKAKKIMAKYLAAYTKKAKNLIGKFAKSFLKKVEIVEKEYKDLKEKKIKPLVEEGENATAVKLMKEQLKEIENYKKDQMATLDKSISSVLDAYTSSINHRIDNPGFVLNVELSEKGKGELKAKWQELIGIQQSKVEESKTELIKSEGWKKLDHMISEMTAFVESRGTGSSADVDIFVQDLVKKSGTSEYEVKVHIRVQHGRVSVQEKGVIIGDNFEDLELKSGVKKVKVTGNYQYSAKSFNLIFSGDEESMVRPYMIVSDVPEPFYGDAALCKNARDEATTPEEKRAEKERIKKGDARILTDKEKDKKKTGLAGEEPMVAGEDK